MIDWLGRWAVAAIFTILLAFGGFAIDEACAQSFIPTGPDPNPQPAPPPNSAVDALDTLRPSTPPYFEPVYETLLRAPLPAQIYRQGGIPAKLRQLERFWNPIGRVATYLPGGGIQTAGNAFFRSLGNGNGRACVTCHQPPSGMGLSLRNIRSRWLATNGTDPLFLPVDGADCPSAVAKELTSGALVGGLTGTGAGRGPNKKAHSLLVSRGTIRIPLPWPPRNQNGGAKPVEFTLAISPVDDKPGCNTHPDYGLSTGFASVYRRPPSSAQMNLKAFSANGAVLAGSLMWDGREPNLTQQAIDATRGHAQAEFDPTAAELAEIVAFQTSLFSAQLSDAEAGPLDVLGGSGGPKSLVGKRAGAGLRQHFQRVQLMERSRRQTGLDRARSGPVQQARVLGEERGRFERPARRRQSGATDHLQHLPQRHALGI